MDKWTRIRMVHEYLWNVQERGQINIKVGGERESHGPLPIIIQKEWAPYCSLIRLRRGTGRRNT